MGTKPTKLTLVGTRITYQAIGDAGMHHTNMCVRKRKDGDKKLHCIVYRWEIKKGQSFAHHQVLVAVYCFSPGEFRFLRY